MSYNFPPKQDLLVNGINIKTINGSSLLGSGDLAISGANTALSNLVAPTSINVQLRAGDGTSAAPTYSFTNSTNTGIRQSGNTLYLTVDGQDVMSSNSGDITFLKNVGFSSWGIFGLYTKSIDIAGLNLRGDGQIGFGGDRVNSVLYTVGRYGDNQNLARPYAVNVANKLTVGKKYLSYSVYGGTLSATQTDDWTTGYTSSANASTTVTITSGSIDSIQSMAGVGDYIQLNGLSTTARITAMSVAFPTATITTDVALGDGTVRTVIFKQSVASFRTNDGVEHVEIDRSGVLNVRNDIAISTEGKGLAIKAGLGNGKIGVASGTSPIAVSTTALIGMTSPVIFVTTQNGSDTASVDNINTTAGTFDILHGPGGGSATVAWMIVETA